MTIQEKKQAILQKKEYKADDLITIVELLRSPGGCPWDIEQTHESIRNGFIEETYEVIEAIDKNDPVLLREELGDVLLQVVFHAQIEREAGNCTFDDIANDICQKMIHRHPHVFGEVQADTSEKVLANWEIIKSEEKERRTVTDKLNAIPRQFPALMRAAKVGKKASMFDFPDAASRKNWRRSVRPWQVVTPLRLKKKLAIFCSASPRLHASWAWMQNRRLARQPTSLSRVFQPLRMLFWRKGPA